MFHVKHISIDNGVGDGLPDVTLQPLRRNHGVLTRINQNTVSRET